MIGVAFLAFGIPAIFKAIGFYRTFTTDADSPVRFVLAAIFGVIMLAFGVGSFVRARRISRT